MNEREIKELVVRAGRELVRSGLVARTWGNVSCRVDNQYFAITPSGRSYETLTPGDIVLCRIEDCSWEGDVKPSSEKGIHALLYRTSPEIGFVIHTHQPMASAIGASGIAAMPVTGYSLLGESVPVAGYGLPGTKKLRDGVGTALVGITGHAVIMSHHGAVCFGSSYEETFSAAQQLEEACRSFIHEGEKRSAPVFEEREFYRFCKALLSGQSTTADTLPPNQISSRRAADGLIAEGKPETYYRLGDREMPESLKIHAEIYAHREDICYIIPSVQSDVLAVSEAKVSLPPLLDDFAQIVGLSARCAPSASPRHVAEALKGRQAVLVPDGGALCCAATRDDALAVRMVMEKNALALIAAKLLGGGKPIGLFDSLLMHAVYKQSYSKKAKGVR